MTQVFVSGCFDLLHTGHVEFLEQAATYGDVHVSIGRDDTILQLKGRLPIYNQDERAMLVRSLKCVSSATVSSGYGLLDFTSDLKIFEPDIFIVNQDGDSEEKRTLIESFGIKYLVLERVPRSGFPYRSTTNLKSLFQIPYRLDLAGGWLDDPTVNKYCSGSVAVLNIEPSFPISERSGLAGGTRKIIGKIWGGALPMLQYETAAKITYAAENEPGKGHRSGSQDAIGLLYPGLNILHYGKNTIWPHKIETIDDNTIFNWLESVLYLIELWPRGTDYDVIADADINPGKACMLANASELFIKAINEKNTSKLGKALSCNLEAQIAMFPRMWNYEIEKVARDIPCDGYKISGAGGGGYLIVAAEEKPKNGIRIKIRRPDNGIN